MGVTSSGARVQGASSLLIAQLARGTRRQIEQAIAPTGLRPTELLVLQHLRERGPSAQQTLAELIGIDATNLVAVLNSLEDAGLIDRRRDRADRRRAIIALFPPGELLLADLDRSLLRVDDQILAPLTGAERQTLHALLTKAVKHIGPECPRHPARAAEAAARWPGPAAQPPMPSSHGLTCADQARCQCCMPNSRSGVGSAAIRPALIAAL